ncbi:MAG TPA: peptide ABC transporter substrate-binding protein [Symbiobacteriaceae bacterium]|nr:peptide ABC transporter substrate-binding protein [Symbiobacteriaceae bacterium]
MRRFIAGFLAVSMLVAVGCSKKTDNNNEPTTDPGKDTPKAGQTIRINIGTDPKTLDPIVSTGVPDAMVQTALFAGLMMLDNDGRPQPDLAKEMPKVTNDGKTYTFTLRDNLKWSNGDPITAEDFIYSWKKALDPRVASEYAYQLHYIVGAKEMNEVALNKVDAKGEEVKGADGKPVPRDDKEIGADFDKAAANFGAKATDAKTIVINLVAPTPYFANLTAFHTLYPVHKKTYEAAPNDWFRKTDMVTSGPFKMVSWNAKDRIIVEKNPNYWDAANVKPAKIEYYLIEQDSTAITMFESGQLDIHEGNIGGAELDRLKKDRPDELKILPDMTVYFYRFNVTKKPFDDVRVRKALSLAIDRQLITGGILKAGQIPAMSLVPSGVPDASGDFRKNGGDYFKAYDLDTAKKLLADAGFPGGKGFPKVTVIYNTNETHKAIAEAVQEMWKKNLGIEVTLENLEFGVKLDRESKLDFEIARAGWQGDYTDPMTFVDMFVTNGGNNQTGWSNKDYDAAIDTAKKTSDPKVRYEAMHKAEKILFDEMPIAPFYFYVRTGLFSKKLTGWEWPLTGQIDLRYAEIK